MSFTAPIFGGGCVLSLIPLSSHLRIISHQPSESFLELYLVSNSSDDLFLSLCSENNTNKKAKNANSFAQKSVNYDRWPPLLVLPFLILPLPPLLLLHLSLLNRLLLLLRALPLQLHLYLPVTTLCIPVPFPCPLLLYGPQHLLLHPRLPELRLLVLPCSPIPPQPGVLLHQSDP